MPSMAEERGELLRTQTMHHILTALGAAEAHTYGHEPAGGVFLDSEDTITRRLYWQEDGTRYQYDAIVRVDIQRREVPRGQ